MAGPTQYDHYLNDDGPAALVIREHLMPVEGADGVLFPATYAAAEDKTKFAGGYNIDNGPNGTNVALIDSVGSQANRIEIMFLPEKYDGRYAKLVPQVVVTAGEKSVNLLEAGHRAGDALVRCSSLQADLQAAFKEVLKGNAEPLAKIAPTSLVFGVWDSRDTQAKLPRVMASTIRAFNVRPLTRSASYLVQLQLDYVKDGLLPEPQTKAEKDEYSVRGFQNALATATHGGVIADDGIRRDATLGLAALRLLRAGDADRTLALRRYILGLALVAFTHNPSGYLRQGCLLVRDKGKENEFVEVHPNGDRKACGITHDDAVKYATEAAKAFGVGGDKTVPFEKERAVRDVKGQTASGGNVTGKISSVELEAKKFTIGTGANKIVVSVNDATQFFKAGAESTFELAASKKAVVMVEMAGEFAGKVTVQ
jgi:CRISPR-associated protein Csb1